MWLKRFVEMDVVRQFAQELLHECQNHSLDNARKVAELPGLAEEGRARELAALLVRDVLHAWELKNQLYEGGGRALRSLKDFMWSPACDTETHARFGGLVCEACAVGLIVRRDVEAAALRAENKALTTKVAEVEAKLEGVRAARTRLSDYDERTAISALGFHGKSGALSDLFAALDHLDAHPSDADRSELEDLAVRAVRAGIQVGHDRSEEKIHEVARRALAAWKSANSGA